MLDLATAAARAGSVAGTAWPRSGVCRAGKSNLPQLLERALAVLALSGELDDAAIFMRGPTGTRESSGAWVLRGARSRPSCGIRRARDRRRFGAARNNADVTRGRTVADDDAASAGGGDLHANSDRAMLPNHLQRSLSPGIRASCRKPR